MKRQKLKDECAEAYIGQEAGALVKGEGEEAPVIPRVRLVSRPAAMNVYLLAMLRTNRM